jgi:hypothetical protein
MTNIKVWVKNNIAPVGRQTKKRGSLFAVIERAFELVKNDAQKAFNAHFPYMADPDKVAEHGKALLIPRFPNDTDAEYQKRVAAASFYFSQAGERGYITGQLSAHFGDRFSTKEEFLKLYVKIVSLDDDDIDWAFGFLDAITDPNILFIFVDVELFKDILDTYDLLTLSADTVLSDTFPGCNELLLEYSEIHLDEHLAPEDKGLAYTYNGALRYNGQARFNNDNRNNNYDKAGVLTLGDAVESQDTFWLSKGVSLTDAYNQTSTGAFRYDGTRSYGGASADTCQIIITKNGQTIQEEL